MLVPLASSAVTSLKRDMMPIARKVATRQEIGRTWLTIHGERYFRYEKAREKGRFRSTRSSKRLMSSYTANNVKNVAEQPARIAPNLPRMYRSSVVRKTRNRARRMSPTRRNGSEGTWDAATSTARAPSAPPRANRIRRDSHRAGASSFSTSSSTSSDSDLEL